MYYKLSNRFGQSNHDSGKGHFEKEQNKIKTNVFNVWMTKLPFSLLRYQNRLKIILLWVLL